MSDVIFRRINGRVIPIKLSRSEKRQAVEGAGLIGAGVGIAAMAGAGHKFMTRKHLGAAAKGFDMIGLDSKRGMSLLGKASKLAKGSTFLRKSSLLTGSVLAGLGVSKIAGSLGLKDEKAKLALDAATAGTIATQAFMIGAFPKAATKDLINKIGKVVIKKAL